MAESLWPRGKNSTGLLYSKQQRRQCEKKKDGRQDMNQGFYCKCQHGCEKKQLEWHSTWAAKKRSIPPERKNLDRRSAEEAGFHLI